ncbi:hypothetical protein FRC19_011858 [Serendipita sp. 401]|nr:hypothetical protein FRC19_011858 [Serendipita sp. 401]KAG9050088.1 hypothetical protein FS842_011407 [Serendipita sp. 407]
MGDKVKTQGAVGPVQPRLEIKVFLGDANKKQFSLYVQALNQLYAEASTSPVSYFGISGIHGRPYVPWDGVDPPGGGGFCVHGTEQFPTWHRPYVVLFEQEIQKRAISIAEAYTTDPDAWKQAAMDLRQPYWDWADPKGILPRVLLDLLFHESVAIGLAPDGAESPVSNPFCQYTFKPGERDKFGVKTFEDWPHTLRYPTTQNPDAASDMLKFIAILNVEAENIRNDTVRLFSITTWTEFSKVGPGTTNSLQQIHDAMHDFIGGIYDGGHMAYIPFAAFDPIFWLHHAQVDRITDQWYRQRQLWAPEADHSPFRNSDTTFWNSSQIQNTASFNYEYKDDLTPFPGGKAGFGDENTILEWSVRIRYKEFELGGNFSILFFLREDENPIPDNPHDLYDLFSASNYVGSLNTFINPEPDQCTNCQEHANDIRYGFVHINRHLLNKPYGGSLDPALVVPLLTERLTWRIFKGDRTRVDPTTSFPSLIIDVIATPLTLAGPMFPDAGEPTIYEGITHGKPGGSRDSQ